MPAGRKIATLYSMAESCVRCCAVWARSLFRCVQVHTLQIVALYTCRISMNMDEYGMRGYLLLRNWKDSNYVWRHVSLRMFTRKRCGHADQQLFDASLLVLLLQRPDLKIPPHYSGWLATDDWAGWSAAVHSKAWIAFNPSQNHLALLRHIYLVGIAAMNIHELQLPKGKMELPIQRNNFHRLVFWVLQIEHAQAISCPIWDCGYRYHEISKLIKFEE